MLLRLQEVEESEIDLDQDEIQKIILLPEEKRVRYTNQDRASELAYDLNAYVCNFYLFNLQ